MNKRLIDSMVLSTTVMMLLSLIPIFPIRAVAGPEIYLDPAANDFDTSITSPCYEWPITIWVKNLTTPVFVWQVLLQIQGATLDWINITAAWNEVDDAAYIFAGMVAQNPLPSYYDFNIDGHNEEVKVGAGGNCGAVVPVSGFGPFKLATVVLHLTRAPGKYENFHVDLVTDNIDTYLLDENLTEIQPLNKYGGHVDYVLVVDLNDDGVVDIKDIATAALAFGSFPGHPRWNPMADLNQDDRIDIKDLVLVATNFGKTY